jgi:hypothetical protein
MIIWSDPMFMERIPSKLSNAMLVAISMILLGGCHTTTVENIDTSQDTSPLMITEEIQPSTALTDIFSPPSSTQGTARPNQDLKPGIVAAVSPDRREERTSTPTSSPRSTSAPAATSSPNIEEICWPFLGDILSLQSWDEEYKALCKGEIVTLPSPIEGASLLDYTPRTGRIAYTLPESEESGVWVYDYWTGQSQKWLDEDVEEALWAPMKNKSGIQPLAVLYKDGQLALVNGPEDVSPMVDDVCCVSWSPLADKIAYAHDNALYIVIVDGGQPRKIAANFNCDPPSEVGWSTTHADAAIGKNPSGRSNTEPLFSPVIRSGSPNWMDRAPLHPQRRPGPSHPADLPARCFGILRAESWYSARRS